MKSPTVIDLFAGAGGLSLGAERAGFHVIGAVELDPKAMESHKKNFPTTLHIQEDVQRLTGKNILSLLKTDSIDGIIGGPPCQGFSNMGKGEVTDSRNDLFIRFFKLVSELQPSFFVAENVPGILQNKYNIIRSNAFDYVRDYELLPPLRVVATDYGAPTSRTRVFFIGYKKNCFSELTQEDFNINKVSSSELVDIETAFSGLTSDLEILNSNDSQVNIDTDIYNQYIYYFSRIINNIPKRMRSVNHTNYLENKIVSGFNKTIHTESVRKRFESIPHGTQDKVSKAKKLDPKGIAPTLRAGTGSDKGSYQAVRPIHYEKGRVITPREAARIQGFPDWFEFDSTIWHSFRQIGNSVSPLVAEGVLLPIYQKLTSLK
ncbi:DNA cytosine methyltransferase [Enterococcus sp. DIV1059_2]|uniref:DNA cytosine methyltransferase n=1 Tax=Enterococcus sp. DIV1059_2 TaxID=2774664 RepID=UPI003F2484A4